MADERTGPTVTVRPGHVWTAERRDRELCAGSIAGLKISNRENVLAAFIRCTADPGKAAKRLGTAA
jgi:hypothetical protein